MRTLTACCCEGRDRPPALLCSFTSPYYQRFFEVHDFVPARGDNLAYAFDLDLTTPQMQRLARLAESVRSRGRYQVAGLIWHSGTAEIDRIHNLTNRSLAHLPDFMPWERSTTASLLEPFRQNRGSRDGALRRNRRGGGGGLAAGYTEPERGADRRQRPALPLELSPVVAADAPPARMSRGEERAGAAEVWDTGQAVLLMDDWHGGQRPRGIAGRISRSLPTTIRARRSWSSTWAPGFTSAIEPIASG